MYRLVIVLFSFLLVHGGVAQGEDRAHAVLPERREIEVPTYLELRQAISAVTSNEIIQLNSAEILFGSEIVIGVPNITIEGHPQNRTTIRCTPGMTQNAFRINETGVTLRSMSVMGCAEYGVIVNGTGGDLQSPLDVLFEDMEFRQNGRRRHIIRGGAVRVTGCSQGRCRRTMARFVSCHWRKNLAEYGGAIFASDADLDIQSSTFRRNEADIAGGAIYSRNARHVSLHIEDSIFEENVARADGETKEIDDVLLVRSVTQKQATDGMGGGIAARNPARLLVHRCEFANNTGRRGGGGMAVVHDRLFPVNRTFSFNISRSLFVDNRGFYGDQSNGLAYVLGGRNAFYGGAIMYESLADIQIEWTVAHVRFVRNGARSGGALSIQSVSLATANHTIVSCVFDENVGLASGGGILIQSANVVIMSTRIVNGRAIYGAGINAIREATMVITRDPEDPSLLTTIENCTATFGGAIFAETIGRMDLAGVVLRNNVAYRYGGGIRLFAIGTAVVFRGVVIENNRALTGGGVACLALRNIIFQDDNGQRSIFRNNTAAVGGGLYYEPGHSIFLIIEMEYTNFVGNKALSSETPELRRFVQEGDEFEPLPESNVEIPDNHEQLGNFTLLSSLTEVDEGHGGGLCLYLVNIRLFTIAEITFRNVTLSKNEAIIGGALSVHMSNLYWNREERSHCIPAAFGLDTCQRFVFYNVTVTRNKALYAGGVFSTLPDGISIACDANSDHWITSTSFISHSSAANQIEPYCSYIGDNEIVDGADIKAVDAGTQAQKLVIEGWDGPLKKVASTDRLVVPCQEDPFNDTCFRDLRIAVRDSFDQTIVRGIDDAHLELTLISNAIIGDLRYMAFEGVAVIDNTFAWGVNISSTLRVVSERDRNVALEVEISTRACRPGEITQVDICRRCPPEQYGFHPSRSSCQGCETNARCHGGAALVPANGYWHSSPFSPIFHECIHPMACDDNGREANLTAYYDNATRVQEDLTELQEYLDKGGPEPEFSHYMQCAVGYEGVLCGSCRDGYGHSRTGSCEECPEQSAREGGLIFLAALWLFILLGINCSITLLSMNTRVQLVKYEVRTDARERPRTLPRSQPIGSTRTSRIMRVIETETSLGSEVFDGQLQEILADQVIATVQLTETLKILINYLQVTSTALHLRTRWNALLNALLDTEATLVGLSSEVLDVPFECHFKGHDTPASISALWIRLAMPWIILASLLLVFSLIWWIVHCQAALHNATQFSVRRNRTRYTTCMIIICIVSLYFSYIDIVRELLRAINCVEVAKEDADIHPDHPYLPYAIESSEKSYWAENTALECFKGHHLPASIVGVLGLMASFGGIVLIVVWLPLNKESVTKTEFVSRYWFLYQAYRKEWYTNAWESTILIRKALIAAVIVFSAHIGPTLQASLCAGILIVAHIMHSFFVPFKTPERHNNVPEYAGDIFEWLRLSKLARSWLAFNNSIHLNTLESASLASSIILFFSAIILHDSNSTSLGRSSMVVFTLMVNISFLFYMIYRLYAGLHVFLDLKLEASDASFMAAHENNMGMYSLFVKIAAMIKAGRNPLGSLRKSQHGSPISVELPEQGEGS